MDSLGIMVIFSPRINLQFAVGDIVNYCCKLFFLQKFSSFLSFFIQICGIVVHLSVRKPPVSSYFFSISQVVAPFFLLSAWALDSVCGSQERSNHAGQIQLGSHLIETLECWNALQDSTVHGVNRLMLLLK